MNKQELNQMQGERDTIEAADLENGSLEGKWFHSFQQDGTVLWQGQVLSAQRDGYFLVQLYSWLDGCPSDQKLIHFSQMVDWNFYPSSEQMNHKYEYHLRFL